jgi:phosphate uptake regulator
MVPGSEGEKGTDDDLMLRRVQRTGGSSLAVTLPKSWTDSNDVRSGHRLLFKNLGDGSLEVSKWKLPQEGAGAGGQKVLNVDATGASANLLCRLLVGAYITGHDRVVLTTMDQENRAGLGIFDCTLKHLIGANLVKDTPDQLEIQMFVDPSKHRFPALLQRSSQLIRIALEGLMSALKEGDPAGLKALLQIEDEIDRLYFLMARQILLSSNDPGMARSIGVTSHHFLIGARMVAKMLEVVGDLIHGVGKDLEVLLARKGPIPRETWEDLAGIVSDLNHLFSMSMASFTLCSVQEASEAIDEGDRLIGESPTIVGRMVKRARSQETALLLQSTVHGLMTAVEMLKVVNEITINRGVEPESVALNGNRPVMTAERGRPKA